MDHVVVEVSDDRVFQHLVLFLDRPEVIRRIYMIRLTNLTSSIEDLVSRYTNISKDIYDLIEQLREEYYYPPSLSPAIISAISRNKIADNDVTRYKAVSYPRKGVLREYFSPILVLPLDPHIRRDRKWYWMHESGKGYDELVEETGEYKTTIESAIKSYRNKLGVKVI